MNLRWNATEYGGVKDLRIPPHRIWKPDVLMYNRYENVYGQIKFWNVKYVILIICTFGIY